MQDQPRVTTQANPTKAKKGPRKFNSLPVPPSQLLPQLIAAKLLAPIPPRPVSNPPPKDLIQKKAHCEYHMGAPGHWTDRCYNLRHKIQDLIDQHLLEFQEGGSKPVITKNPSPTRGINETGPSNSAD